MQKEVFAPSGWNLAASRSNPADTLSDRFASKASQVDPLVYHDHAAMPWFRRSQKSKRRLRITKKDISEPADFRHCYHASAVVDPNSSGEEYSGLPPQWPSKFVPVEEESPKALGQTAEGGSNNVRGGVVAVEKKAPRASKGEKKASRAASAPLKRDTSSNNVLLEAAAISEDDSIVSTGRLPGGGARSSSKHSIASSNSVLSLTKRPSPTRIRDSSDNTSMEDTIKFIRKHCQNRSNESVQEEDLHLRSSSGGKPSSSSSASSHSQQQDKEREMHVVSRGRFYSQPRAGSFMQLRASPVNRKHVVSYTSSSTTAMTHAAGGGSRDQMPSSAFCLSAPSEVVQSDLGLYSFNRSTDTSSGLSHYRINSPSESSGYFGSNGSSLCCNSRMSSAQQISCTLPANSQGQQPHYTVIATGHGVSRQAEVQDIEEDAELSPVSVTPTSATPTNSSYQQQRFYSLQRHHHYHHDPATSVGGQQQQHTQNYHRHMATSSLGSQPIVGGALRGGVMSHYGTAPRTHRNLHGTYSTGLTSSNSEAENFQMIHEGLESMSAATTTDPLHHDRHGYYAHEPPTSTGKTSMGVAYGGSKEKRSSRMNFEQFRTTLELLVNPQDPRREYVDFVKIGEGSTGNVYTARRVSTNQVVAVKKMNLRKQQRRELLFNEVSEGVMPIRLAW